MRDYWLTQLALGAIGWTYIALTVVGIALALWLPKSKTGKASWAFVVLFLVSIWPIRSYQEYERARPALELQKSRYATAKALFEVRCKAAGERIQSTVQGVDGIQLLNVRYPAGAADYANNLWPQAGLPLEGGGEWYLISFLGWEQRQNGRVGINLVPTELPGFQYVDVKASDGTYLRRQLERVEFPAGTQWRVGAGVPTSHPSRYAVQFENLIDPIDRAHWIAGVKLKVFDTETGQQLAERISYSFEPGLGSTKGGRSPWAFAVGCPQFIRATQTRQFVDRVLIKKPG